MITVQVKITETLERTVSIHGATDIHKALESVRDEYKSTNIVLDSSDFVGVMFSAEILKEDDTVCQI